MTVQEALYDFWNKFRLRAYEENSVDNEKTPYITFEVINGDFTEPQLLSASIWYRSESWKEPTMKENEIREYIGNDGVYIDCDDGMLWIQRGSPFSQNMGDDADDKIKRKSLLITVEYLR